MPDRLRLALGAAGWAIDFVDCPDIAHQTARVLAGWHATLSQTDKLASVSSRAVITQRRNNFWTWRSIGAPRPRYWQERPPLTPMHVVCEVHDVCIDWFLAKHANYLCLHGAAADIGDGLVCFPSIGKAGKSTLVAHLAALGQRIFCDDVLGIERGRNNGVSLGLPPRLRSPLPRRTTKPIRSFIRNQRGYADRDWIYLALKSNLLAQLGETAPIKAFVFLDRQNKGPPQLKPAAKSYVLKELISQNIAQKIPPRDIFDRLHILATTRPGYYLTYSDPLDASHFLIEAFKGITS
jgi:hypothetical protein